MNGFGFNFDFGFGNRTQQKRVQKGQSIRINLGITLEEVFIYELGGLGYELENIIV